jgi:regulatory protein
VAGRRRGARDGEDRAGSGEATADLEATARDTCLRLLTAKPRSRAELDAALARKDVPTEVAERVLDRLGEVGLVDDVAYADMVVQSGQRHRRLGRRALSAELRRRGVDDEVAGEAVATMDPEDEQRAARALVERKLRAMVGLDEPTRIRRLVGMLARRGHSEGIAFRVVREVLREQGSETEMPDPEHVT